MDIVLQVIWAFISWLKIPVLIILAIVVLFYLLICFNIFIGLMTGKRFKKGTYVRTKKRSIIRRLFVDLPKRIADDKFDKDPSEFGYKGLIIFEGRQGRGKTIAMCEFARRIKQEFPKSKCLSNLNFKFEDLELKNWTDLVDFTNGKFGVVAMMDETQNWFSSNQSKDFPPEMLETITQNRKNRRIILGTSQNFYLLAKAIRSQATEVRRCATYFGALTIVKRVEPILDSDGNVREWRSLGYYFFVHDKELRNSYDTYHVIKSLRKSGFAPQKENIVTNVVINNTRKKWGS